MFLNFALEIISDHVEHLNI